MSVARGLFLAIVALSILSDVARSQETSFSQEMPALRTRVTVPYPARARGLAGTVHVHALIDSTGRVAETKIVRSVPGLDSVAVASVRQWRFEPPMANGRPITAWFRIPLSFSADSDTARSGGGGPECAVAVAGTDWGDRPAPSVCAVGSGDGIAIAIGDEPFQYLDDVFTNEPWPPPMPDSCEVELALLPNGFAVERWPCDRAKQRFLIPVSKTNRAWLLSSEGVRIERVESLDGWKGVTLRPIDLWLRVRGDLPSARFIDLFEAPSDEKFGADWLVDVEMPEPIERVMPKYPLQATALERSGQVVLRGKVGADGRVHVAIVKQSVPTLDGAALEAFRLWRFKPARLGGKPISVWVTQPIRFTFGESQVPEAWKR